MVGRSLTMMRGITSTATTTTPAAHSTKFEIPSAAGWKRGHASRGSVGERIQVIPGFKTSAAFLSSLGANLRIADDDLFPSPATTPLLRPTYDLHDHDLPPPSPLIQAIYSEEDDLESSSGSDGSLAGPSTLDGHLHSNIHTALATSDADVLAGLRLVAESVREQHYTAARILILHPFNLAAFVLLFSLLMQTVYTPGSSNFGAMLMTAAGFTIMALVVVRHLTAGYIYAAGDINTTWLGNDQIILSKLPTPNGEDEIVGAVVLSWEKPEGRGNRRRKGGKSIVRAWTVAAKYRKRGIGMELLEEAVRITEKRGGDEVVFAEEHANSKEVLPRWYRGAMARKEEGYRAVLEGVVSEGLGVIGRRRRSM